MNWSDNMLITEHKLRQIIRSVLKEHTGDTEEKNAEEICAKLEGKFPGVCAKLPGDLEQDEEKEVAYYIEEDLGCLGIDYDTSLTYEKMIENYCSQ